MARMYLLFFFVFFNHCVYAVDRSKCALDKDSLRPPADVIIGGFASYQSYVDKAKPIDIQNVIKKIVYLTKTKKIITQIEVVGHAAKYGSSNFAETSRRRAEAVQSDIEAAYVIKYPENDEADLPFNTYGISTHCPISENGTKVGRAMNRRVEVWIHYKAKPRPKLPKPKKVPSLDKLIDFTYSNTDNPTTKCIAEKLQKGSNDFEYLSSGTVQKAMNEKLNGDTLYDYLDHTANIHKDAKKARRMILKVSTSESNELRFMKALNRRKNDLITVIRIDLTLKACEDWRMHAMRRYVLRKSKKTKSIYSCKYVKREVDRMLTEIGGSIVGCGKGY